MRSKSTTVTAPLVRPSVRLLYSPGASTGSASDGLVGVDGEQLDPLFLAFVVQREVAARQSGHRRAALVVDDDADFDETGVAAENRRDLRRRGGCLRERGGDEEAARQSGDREYATHTG